MMEDYGWNLVASGRKASSHSGRKTGVSVLDALTEGRSRSQIMEWMLVTDVILVGHYCERDYSVTPFCGQDVRLDVSTEVDQYIMSKMSRTDFQRPI